MSLLFDQNISYRILKDLLEYFPNSKQVRELSLEEKQDQVIWQYAKKNGYTIVTFDSDFVDLSILFHFPPKVIWLKLGNTSTKNIASELIKRKSVIEEFIVNQDEGVLKIDSGF
jgi:predicted nuclease of predicted toxin-antitoxin system